MTMELPAIIDYAAEHGFTVRFIEFMPMSNGLDWEKSYLSTEDIIKDAGGPGAGRSQLGSASKITRLLLPAS